MDRRVPDAIVKEKSTPEPIKIVLGPQAGRLIVTIIDDATDKTIDSGSVTQCRVNEPKSCWQRMQSFPNGQYELLTPEVVNQPERHEWRFGPFQRGQDRDRRKRARDAEENQKRLAADAVRDRAVHWLQHGCENQ